MHSLTLKLEYDKATGLVILKAVNKPMSLKRQKDHKNIVKQGNGVR